MKPVCCISACATSLHGRGRDQAQLPLQTTPQFPVPRAGEESPEKVQAEKPATGNSWSPLEKLVQLRKEECPALLQEISLRTPQKTLASKGAVWKEKQKA